jgi:undecaprenyl-diphosphatase
MLIGRLSLPGFDRRLCRVANRWGDRDVVARFFAAISRLGDGAFWYTLMLALALSGDARGARAAAHMLITGAVALVLYRGLKCWTRRPRPFRACAGVIAHLPPLDEFSFPSGHTLHAVSFSVVALAYFPALAPLLLTFTALVAASRVVLGLHYPSDVLAAIALGCALGGASLQIGMWL